MLTSQQHAAMHVTWKASSSKHFSILFTLIKFHCRYVLY